MNIFFVKVRSATRLLRIDIRDAHRTIGTLHRDRYGWIARLRSGEVLCGQRKRDVRARSMRNHP